MLETKIINRIKFSVLSNKQMESMGYVTVKESANSWERTPIPESLNDPLMGTTNGICKLCRLSSNNDLGHLGKIELLKPVISPLFIKDVVSLLNIMCIRCRALLIGPEKRNIVRTLPMNERLNKIKSLNARQRNCMFCGYTNPSFKLSKMSKYLIKMTGNGLKPDAHIAPEFISEYFSSLTDDDILLLGIACRPENFIWHYVMVVPPAMRPSIQSGDIHSEDGLNVILKNVLKHNNKLISLYKQGNIYDGYYYTSDFRSEFEAMNVFIYSYVNSTATTDSISYMKNAEKLKSIVMLNKGKEGAIRKNMSTKRQKQCARAVITPDPYLPVDILAIPQSVAEKLTIEETVTPWNYERLRKCIINGRKKYPGAHHVIKASNNSNVALIGDDYLKHVGVLENGDVVARMLMNDDIVIFNRQPSIHQYSMMAFRIYVILASAESTFGFNPTSCAPFNADFDGDAMNIFVPQSYKAISEARHLMYNHRHIVSDSGKVLIKLLHNNILGNYLISKYFGKRISNEMFYDLAFSTNMDSKEIMRKIKRLGNRAFYFEDLYELILPEDLTIDNKKIKIINGKIVPINNKVIVKEIINDAQLRVKVYYTVDGHDIQDEIFDPYKKYVTVPTGTAIFPILDDDIINKILVKYIFNNYPFTVTTGVMNGLINIAARFILIHGFTNTISDINLTTEEQKTVIDATVEHHQKYMELLSQFEKQEIQIPIYRTPSQEFETMVWNIDNVANRKIEEIASKHMNSNNGNFYDLIRSGTKGELINVSQIACQMGTQVINGGRFPKVLGHRSLPHQPKYDEDPLYGGFIINSFNSGMNPIEDYIHVSGSRLGLADTGVNMGKVGYLSRKLLTFLQDIVISNDNLCRRTGGKIINFTTNGCGFNNKALVETANPIVKMSQSEYNKIYVWD